MWRSFLAYSKRLVKGKIIILFLCFTCIHNAGIAQSCKTIDANPPLNTAINQFLMSERTSLGARADFTETLTKTVEDLERIQKKKKSDVRFLRSIFYRIHKNSLIKYDKQATMDETLKSGRFGCLSGTAIYAIVLEHFNYDYDIIELPNHVFLKVNLKGRTMILESTLPDDGFITLNTELSEILEQKGFDPRNIKTLTTVGVGSVDEWSLVDGHNKISLRELSGLQYFNEAVRLYTQKEYIKSMDMINEAYTRYPSKRNEKLMQLVINKILKYDSIKEEIKNKYLKQYIKVVKRQKLSQTK